MSGGSLSIQSGSVSQFIRHVLDELVVQRIRLEGAVTELFDVAVLPGVRRTSATGFLTSDIHAMITLEA